MFWRTETYKQRNNWILTLESSLLGSAMWKMYMNENIYLIWSYFLYILHMALPTKEFFKGTIKLFLWFSVFYLQNTNRCISSIVYENPTTFSLVQRFPMTVIKKYMLCPSVVFNRLDIICTYVHSIIHWSHNTGCTPGYSFYSWYWSHVHNISHTWGIFYLRYMWILHSSRRALSV